MNRTDRLDAIVEELRGRAPDWMSASVLAPPLNLTSGEVTAIATALSTPGSSPFNASGRSALRKILAVLRDVDADGARALAQRIHVFDDKQHARPRPPAALEHAILEGRVVTLDYVDGSGTSSDRPVEPLAVVGDPPHWYLWAWCRLRDAPRMFRIDRINGAVVHDEFAPDRSANPDTHFPAGGRSILDGV